MNYQVWTHDEYQGWNKKDCDDLAAAQQEIMEALKRGAEPLLTVEVPYDVNIKVKEDRVGETVKSKAKPVTGAGAEGEGKAGRRDTEATGKVNS